MRYLIIIGALNFFLIHNHLLAQTAFVTVGGDLLSEEGSVSFSVGQIAYKSLSGNDGNVNQGVQHPYEIYVLTAADNIALKDFECNAFPNPTNDLLVLSIKNKEPFGLSYQLVNSTGCLLDQKDIQDEETTLSMKIYTPAVYFLRLIENENIVRTFKIIKH